MLINELNSAAHQQNYETWCIIENVIFSDVTQYYEIKNRLELDIIVIYKIFHILLNALIFFIEVNTIKKFWNVTKEV